MRQWLTHTSRAGHCEWVNVSALCHVWTAPSWQELSSRLQHWSVQPCVRPHMMVSPSSADLGRPRSNKQTLYFGLRVPRQRLAETGPQLGQTTMPVAEQWV